MSKIIYKNRIDIYNKIKNVESSTYLLRQYAIDIGKIRYLVRLIDKHSYDILRASRNIRFIILIT